MVGTGGSYGDDEVSGCLEGVHIKEDYTFKLHHIFHAVFSFYVKKLSFYAILPFFSLFSRIQLNRALGKMREHPRNSAYPQGKDNRAPGQARDRLTEGWPDRAS